MHARDRHEPAVADERAQHAGDVGGLVVVLVGAGFALGLGPGRERERLAEEVQRPVVAPDDEPDVDEPLHAPGPRRAASSPESRPHRVDVGRAQHQRREHGAPVVVGEEPDQLPSGEGRRRHAN